MIDNNLLNPVNFGTYQLEQAMPQKCIRRRSGLVVATLAAMLMLPGVSAQLLDATVETEIAINKAASDSQNHVTDLAQQTADLLAEYRDVVRVTDALKIYNDNLETVVSDQREEIQSINRQLSGLEGTNRGIVPLMLEMIDVLDKIVENDMPFRLQERRSRVARLHAMMARANVTTSEKYRRVMEAYQGELEYGRSTEAYADTLPETGQTVDFLRVGRTLLVYQSSDQAVTGWFNPTTREYEALPDRYRRDVKLGLAIARNVRAPDLVMLPVPAAEAGK